MHCFVTFAVFAVMLLRDFCKSRQLGHGITSGSNPFYTIPFFAASLLTESGRPGPLQGGEQITMALTPQQEAAYALDYGLDPDDLSHEARAEYDRIKPDYARLKQEAYLANTQGAPPPPTADADGAAIAGLICAFFIAILGIIFGHVSRSQAKRAGKQPSGVATAGSVLGYIFTAITVIAIIAVAVAAAKAASSVQVPCDVTNPNWPC
jgi:hypothetical protein